MGLIITAKNLGVSIAVKDLDATSKWYQDYLGFEKTIYRDFPDYGTRIQFLKADGVQIELIEDKQWKPSGRGTPPWHTTVQGVSQITFRVDDIREVRDRVGKLPVEIAWDVIVVEDIGFKEFFIRDNEGNLIQFVETAYRYAGDK